MKKNTSKNLFTFIFLFLGFGLGGVVTLNSWEGKIFFYPSQEASDSRTPAAINRKIDISSFQGTSFRNASAQRLLLGAETVKKENQVGLTLGHFIRVDSLGKKQFACDFYRFIEMTFQGEGLSVSGERLKIKVVAPCRRGKSSDLIETIWFPDRKSLETANLAKPILLGEQSTLFMYNFYGFWPDRWVLSSIKLIRAPSSQDNLLLSKREINRALRSHFFLEW